MTKRKSAKAPSPPPASGDMAGFTVLSKLTLSPGDQLETADGQRFVYTADLRGSRWGRTVCAGGTGSFNELPDVPVRVVRSPNAGSQEQKGIVEDPMANTRR